MNRVIKFRAWDGDKIIYQSEDGWFDKVKHPECQSPQCMQFASVMRVCKIMQFTGLTDKNGVEIYEGDVLVSTFGNGLPFVIKFGEYHDSSGDDDLATAIGFYILEQDGTESLFGKSVNGDTDCYQVIGNVFQNLSTNHL